MNLFILQNRRCHGRGRLSHGRRSHGHFASWDLCADRVSKLSTWDCGHHFKYEAARYSIHGALASGWSAGSVPLNVANFLSISNQRPDLAIQDLQNIFPARFSDQRPDFSKTAVTLEKQSYHRAHDVLIHLLSYFRTDW